MTKEALDTRTAYITTDEGVGKTIVSTKKLVISLTATLPLVMMDTETITSKIVTSNTTVPLLSLDLVPNGITDPDYLAANLVERYTYISSCTSGITKSKLRIYYDGLYKDIIIIPDLKDLGETGTVGDPTAGQTFGILGYHVGGGTINEVERTNYTLTLNEANKFDLPLANTNIQLSILEAKLHGLTPRSNLDMSVGVAINAETTVYSTKDKLSTIIDFGAYSNLFTVEGLIPVYQLYQRSPNNFSTKYIGTKIVQSGTKLYIPLDF